MIFVLSFHWNTPSVNVPSVGVLLTKSPNKSIVPLPLPPPHERSTTLTLLSVTADCIVILLGVTCMSKSITYPFSSYIVNTKSSVFVELVKV